MNYYSKYIRNYSGILQPLTDHIKGDDEKGKINIPVTLAKEAKDAINMIKEKLITAPILSFPRWDSLTHTYFTQMLVLLLLHI